MDQNIGRQFSAKIDMQMGRQPVKEHTSSYAEFKKTFYPKHLNFYEALCNRFEKILKIRPDAKKEAQLLEYIRISHLNITPAGAMSVSIFIPSIIGILFCLLFLVIAPSAFFMFMIFGIILTLVLIMVFLRIPEFIANSFRLKASNQMVLCIFYVVMYMRHTSNLELAIDFAAERTGTPLSFDLKKILWDVETGTYGTIKESLDTYLEGWRAYNIEFIESFHLIESSLYEGSEDRRISVLEKGLQTMLEETFEKMLHYSHDLKGPLQLLYMIGVILPLLGLIVLPLIASFLTGDTMSPYILTIIIALLYNVTIPLLVYYLGRMVLSKRPTGFGETIIDSDKPDSSSIASPLTFSIVILAVCLFFGTMPVWLHAMAPKFSDPDLSGKLALNYRLLVYKTTPTGTIGPYGLIATVLSVLIVFGIGIAIGTFYFAKTANTMKRRDTGKALEREFAASLFQLGNRLGDGVPAEAAFGKVATVSKGTKTGEFFELVSNNITRLGMDVERAIFDSKVGAIIYFPSALIESSMRVLVESSKKGPRAASTALINVSIYVKDIHRVNERVRDLLVEILSDMKQQVGLLTPAIAAIVVGITSMIVYIVTQLGSQLAALSNDPDIAAVPVNITTFGNPIPTFYFQIIVGLYVLELIFILSVLINGIENGSDKISEQNLVGKNLISGTLLYCIISTIVILFFNTLATVLLQVLLPAG